MNRPRWLAIDADMFGKRFTHDLHDRFGPMGVVLWMAFLCACKMSPRQGTVRMANDRDGMDILGLADWDLITDKGEPFTLSEFFNFTGRKKQTRRVPVQRPDSQRIATAHLLDVHATHWEHWQDAARTDTERLRKRRWIEEKRRRGGIAHGVASASRSRRDVDADIDLDLDNPPTPQGGSNGRVVESQKRTCTTCFVAPCVCPTEPDLPADQLATRAAQLRKPS